MKKKIFSGFLVLVLLLGTVQPALAAETAATMKLSATEGTVTVSNASGRSLTVRDNMRLYSGYQVETAANSYAWINLDDTKLIKLDASTEAEIRKSGKKLELLLESGSMYGDVSRPLEADETLDIRTSTAIVGIRGTKFSVAQAKQPAQDTQAAGRITQVQVYEGSVAVTAQQETPETAAVTAGNQLTVHPGTEGTETFAASQLSSGHISGYAAVELVKNPETLENLGIGISLEAARELLAQDQADAARRQAEAGKTSLETAAAPSVLWGTGSDSTPSGGGGSTTRPEPEPQPDPDPEPEPGPDPTPLPTYTVTFDPNGGSVSPGSLTTGTDGKLDSAAAAPVPSRTGYTFLGWFTDLTGGAKADLTAVFTANTTFYARWEANTYTVTFDPNGGAGGGAVLTDVSGLLTERIADPTRDGYVFDGWYTAASGGTKADLTAAFPANTTLYAQWTALPAYTVTFDPNGGTLTGDSTAATNVEGKLSTLPAPTRDANTGATATYTFNGWYTSAEGGTTVTTDTKFSADATVYAHWTMSGWDWALNSGALRISGSGAMPDFAASSPPWSDNASAITSVTIDSGITSVGMTAFAGFINLTGVTLPQSVTSIGSYAFQDCNKLANVSFSGTPAFEELGLGMNVFLNCTALTSFTVPSGVTEVQQYTFSGCTSLTTVTIPASATAVSADAFDGCTGLTGITFGGTKAQWNAFSYKAPGGVTVTCSDGTLPEYVVTFNLGSGKWTDSSIPVEFTVGADGKLPVTIPDPVQDGYAFDGWYVGVGGADGQPSEQAIEPNQYQFTGNTDVNAKWQENALDFTLSDYTTQAEALTAIQNALDNSAYTRVNVTTSASTLSIQSDLTVPAGKVLRLDCPFTLGSADGSTQRTLTVNGTLSLYQAGTICSNSKIIIAGTGTIEDDGKVTINSGGAVENAGTFNTGYGGKDYLIIEAGGTFTNTGYVHLSYYNALTNNGSFVNEAGSVFDASAGSADNTGTLTNEGTYYGPALTGGTIDGANASQVTAGNPKP